MGIEEIIRNKSHIIWQKKNAIKYADAFSGALKIYDKEDAEKGIGAIEPETETIKVKTVINTTNLLDSHGDVHLGGIWNKSLSENKSFYHLEMHKSDFDHVISDDAKAKAEYVEWKELGYDYEGKTQALIFTSKISKSDNPKMFDNYAKGKVKNHSVGMRYVKIELAVNDDRYKEEKAVWDKYIGEVANREEAEAKGYFWAVKEAKIIEGSAVLMGSNFATPTIEVSAAKGTEDIEPSNDTHKTKAEVASFLSILAKQKL
jgi:hypothetical protein